eukprot:symbB.v1.2.003042.t2/scaffold167.1/size289592/7
MDRKRLNEREEVFGYTSLSLAASVGHVKVVSMLLDAKADLELRCNLGNSALHMAARAGHTAVVRALVVHKAALESKNEEGWTPLIWGSMNGHQEVVAALLNSKVKVQAVDIQGLSALMWATRHGHVDVMKSILATGPDLSQKDFAGHSVMHHARQHRAARKMLQQFEELNRRLLHSAKSGDVATASMALQAGAFVDALDDSGSSPLLLAASQRDFTMVKLLARHGADLSLEASNRTNSPWLRSMEYRSNIQEVLRDAVKANRWLVSSAKEGYWDGVFQASDRDIPNRHLKQQAIDHGAWLDLADESQRTCLAWAASHGNAQAVRELLQAGASVDSRDSCGWTPLAWAAHNNWPKVASILHYQKADLNTRTFTGDTLSHLAAKSNHCVTLAFLSAAGIDLDLQDFQGHSPLQVTVISGKVVAARCLLLLKANPDQRDEGGRSIVALAAVHGQHALLENLLGVPKQVESQTGGAPQSFKARKTLMPGKAEANVESFKAGRKSLKEANFDSFKVRRSMKQEHQGLAPVDEDGNLDTHSGDEKLPEKHEKRHSTRGRGREDASPHSHSGDEKHEKRHSTKGRGREDASPHSHSGDEKHEKRHSTKGRGREEHSSNSKGESEKSSKDGAVADLRTLTKDESVASQDGKMEGAEENELTEREERQRKQKIEDEMPDLQLYWQAEALLKKLPKKVDFSVAKVLGETDNDGRTPLGLAVLAAHPRVVYFLLERKASIDAIDAGGNTVLMLAASSTSRNALMIVELLLGLNANVQAENNEKKRAVDLAKAPKIRSLLQIHMDRLEVGQKLKSSQSLPALKAKNPPKPVEDGKSHPALAHGWQARGGRVRLESLPDLPLDELEEQILSLVSQRRAPVPQHLEVVVHPITQRSLGYAYVDYEDELTATLLADAKCDVKKDPFRGTVRVLKEVTHLPTKSEGDAGTLRPRGSLSFTE